MSIVLVSSLTFVPLIICFGCFYLLVVLLEHFIGKVEFIVELILPFEVLIESIDYFIND